MALPLPAIGCYFCILEFIEDADGEIALFASGSRERETPFAGAAHRERGEAEV